MALTEERKAALLAYCKLTELADDPEVEALIPAFYEAAVGYMEGAGITEPAADTARRAQYDLCVNAMVLDAYDRRDITITGTIVADNPAFRRLITQLKLTEPVSNLDAGSLDERLELLELQETAPNTWEWVVVSRLWGQVTVDGGTNLFSRVGIGARNAKLTIRSRDITLYGALRWRGQHLFLTSITKLDRMHLDLQAALVSVVRCVGQGYTTTVGPGNRPVKQPGPERTFPGVLTEKYVRYETEDSYAKAKRLLVLVTPKAVQLLEGDLVTVTEGPAAAVYNVQSSHVLDEYKNEYEIMYSRDI